MSVGEVRRRAIRTVSSRLVIDGALVGGALIALCSWLLDRPGSADFEAEQRATELIPIAFSGMTSTGLLSAWALRGAAARTAWHDFVRPLGAAVLNAPACFALHGAMLVVTGAYHHVWAPSDLFLFPMGAAALTVVSLVVSLPLGLAYGNVHMIAMGALRRELAQPSWRALTRARAIGIVVSVLCAIVMLGLGRANHGFADLLLVPTTAIASLAAIDAALWLVDVARVRRWRSAIARDAAWCVVPASRARVNPALAPLEPIAGEASAIVSARTLDAYRERPWAIALVPPR